MAVTLIDTDVLNRLIDIIEGEPELARNARAQTLLARTREYIVGPLFDEGKPDDTRQLWLVDRYLPFASYIATDDEDEAINAVVARDEELYGQDTLLDYTITDTDRPTS